MALSEKERFHFLASVSRWVGYREKATDNTAYYDDLTANAGDRNFNRFSRRFDLLVCGGRRAKDGYPWCATFVFSCLYDGIHHARTGTWPALEDPKDPDTWRRMVEVLGTSDFTYLAGVARWLQMLGGRRTENPQAGDIVVFLSTHGKPRHIGVVTTPGKTEFRTIEGNTSAAAHVDANGGSCEKKRRLRNYVVFLSI